MKKGNKGNGTLLTCPCITMWAKLKTYIASWKLVCMKEGWQVFHSVWGGQGCREVSLSPPLAWAAVQDWELRRDLAARLRQLWWRQVPGFKAEHIKERICFGVHLWGRAGQKQVWNRSLWLSLRDLLHKGGDADFWNPKIEMWQSWKCRHLLLQSPQPCLISMHREL